MTGRTRWRFLGLMLLAGFHGNASALYADGNPMGNVDPDGLDVVVVTGGYRGGFNIFGHTAMAVQGHGMFSYGNDTPLRSSLGDYLRSQSGYRDQMITIVPRTPAQDAAAAAFFSTMPGRNNVGYLDNCAVRTNQGLEAAGLPVSGIPFPGGADADEPREAVSSSTRAPRHFPPADTSAKW